MYVVCAIKMNSCRDVLGFTTESYQPTGAGFVRSLQRYSYKCHIRAWIISKYELADSFVYRIGIAYPV